jgi:hypothetical protein
MKWVGNFAAETYPCNGNILCNSPQAAFKETGALSSKLP